MSACYMILAAVRSGEMRLSIKSLLLHQRINKRHRIEGVGDLVFLAQEEVEAVAVIRHPASRLMAEARASCFRSL